MNHDLVLFNENKDAIPELWYIASPYQDPDKKVIESRVKELKKCIKLISTKYPFVVPFSPILYVRSLGRIGAKIHKSVYSFDLGILDKADRLIVLEINGWRESVGVAIEIAYARGKGIPIEHLPPTHLTIKIDH